MKKSILPVAMAVAAMLYMPSIAQESGIVVEKESASDKDADAALNTIALINHINYVVEVIRSYNNVLALEEEYQKITADNLNLNRIPDEEVLGLIRSILDVLHGMRMSERDREWLLRVMKRNMDGAKLDRTAKMASTFVNGFGGVTNSSLKGIVRQGFGFSWLEIAQSAVDVQFEYKKALQDLRNEFSDKQFELDTQKLEQLHSLTDTLLEKQWSLIAKYGLDDKLRITTREVQNLVKCLKDTDRKRCFTQLKPMAPKFEVYPTYWHYRAAMALSCGEYEDVLYSSDHFFKINRGLFRYDPMAANVAMFKTTAILQQQSQKTIDTSTKDTIRRCIERVCECNYNSENAEQGIFCASVYFFALNDAGKALEVLEPLEARLSAESESDLVDYCDLSKSPEKKLRKAPMTADIAQCRMLRLAIEQKTGESISIERLKEICEQETTGSLEKLFYFGQLRISDLWELAKKDVVAINCGIAEGNLVVQLPVSWFLLGDIDIEVHLLRGSDVVRKLICTNDKFELVEERVKLVDGSKIETYGSFTMPVSEEDLKKSTGAELIIKHVSWPVTIDYLFSKPLANKDQMFVPTEIVSFMNRPLGQKLLSDDYSQDFKELIDDADAGDINSQFILGLYYYEGAGVEQDYVEAVKWFRKSAEQGVSNAQFYLGQCYLMGRGIEENEGEALFWLKKAAEQNNDEAQYKIGLIYEFGVGVKKNDEEALKWHLKAAAQDNEGEESNARYRARALEADLKRRSYICKELNDSGIKLGSSFFSLDEFYLATLSNHACEKRDKAVEMINEKLEGCVFEKDVLFWNEPYDEKHSTIIITSESLFYLHGDEIKKWDLEDINNLDWERKSDGNILINGTPCKIVVKYRKPFVDAMKKILERVRQEKNNEDAVVSP